MRRWKISGFTGFCLGYALLIFAPGNFNRLQIHQNDNSVFLASELINTMMEEIRSAIEDNRFAEYKKTKSEHLDDIL